MTKKQREPKSNAYEVEQHKRFLEAARALECDEDKEKFEARLGKIAGRKPQRAEPEGKKLTASEKAAHLSKK